MTRRLACRVDSIADHGDRVYTVTLRPDRPAPAFRPGQFLHLALDPYDPAGFWPESRVFSIASSPSHRATLEICYSVKGHFTSRMERELTEGGTVWVKLPYGDFVVDGHDDVVLLAGGTGISAFTAYLESLVAGAPRSVVLGYGARTPALLLYASLIDRTRAAVPGFRSACFVENPGGGPVLPDDLALMPGRLDVDAVWALAPRPLEAGYFISGPPLMLQAIAAGLRKKGLSDGAIHTDAWE